MRTVLSLRFWLVERRFLNNAELNVMSGDIPENDWREFKRIYTKLLNLYCERSLIELEKTTSSGEGSPHERYLRAYKLMMQRDKKIGEMFNDYRRSTAQFQLSLMRKNGLLLDADVEVFSEETQRIIRMLDPV